MSNRSSRKSWNFIPWYNSNELYLPQYPEDPEPWPPYDNSVRLSSTGSRKHHEVSSRGSSSNYGASYAYNNYAYDNYAYYDNGYFSQNPFRSTPRSYRVKGNRNVKRQGKGRTKCAIISVIVCVLALLGVAVGVSIYLIDQNPTTKDLKGSTADTTTQSPTVITPAPLPVFDGSLTLSTPWNQNLSDPNSEDYKTLAKNAEDAIDATYRNSSVGSNYNYSKVIGFSQGSTVIDFQSFYHNIVIEISKQDGTVVKQPISATLVQEILKTKIETAEQSDDPKISIFVVAIAESVGVTQQTATTTAATTTTTQGTTVPTTTTQTTTVPTTTTQTTTVPTTTPAKTTKPSTTTTTQTTTVPTTMTLTTTTVTSTAATTAAKTTDATTTAKTDTPTTTVKTTAPTTTVKATASTTTIKATSPTTSSSQTTASTTTIKATSPTTSSSQTTASPSSTTINATGPTTTTNITTVLTSVSTATGQPTTTVKTETSTTSSAKTDTTTKLILSTISTSTDSTMTTTVNPCQNEEDLRTVALTCVLGLIQRIQTASKSEFCGVMYEVLQCVQTAVYNKTMVTCTEQDGYRLIQKYGSDIQSQLSLPNNPADCIPTTTTPAGTTATVVTSASPLTTPTMQHCDERDWIKSEMKEHCESAVEYFRKHPKNEPCRTYMDVLGCLMFSWKLTNKPSEKECSIQDVAKLIAKDKFSFFVDGVDDFDPGNCFDGNTPLPLTTNVTRPFCEHPDVVTYHARYPCSGTFSAQGWDDEELCRLYHMKLGCVLVNIESMRALENCSHAQITRAFDGYIHRNMPGIGQALNLTTCHDLPKNTCSSFMYEDVKLGYKCGRIYGEALNIPNVTPDLLCLAGGSAFECMYRGGRHNGLVCDRYKMANDIIPWFKAITTFYSDINLTRTDYNSCLQHAVNITGFGAGRQEEDSRALVFMGYSCLGFLRSTPEVALCSSLTEGSIPCWQGVVNGLSGHYHSREDLINALAKESQLVTALVGKNLSECLEAADTCIPISLLSTDPGIANATSECFGGFYFLLFTPGVQQNTDLLCSIYNDGTSCLQKKIAPFGYNCSSSALRDVMDIATSYVLAALNMTHIFDSEQCSGTSSSCLPLAAFTTDPRVGTAMSSCFGSFYHLLSLTTVQTDRDLICSLYSFGTVCMKRAIAPYGYNCSLTSLKSSVDTLTSYVLPTINSAHLFDPEQCPVTPIPGPTPAAEDIPASLTLNKPFHSDLLNKSSTMYKELVKNITEALEDILKTVDGKVMVTRVRNGSIVVEFTIMVMTSNRDDSTKVIFGMLEAEIPKSNTILSTYVNGTLKIVSGDSDSCPPLATLVAEKRFETAMKACFGTFFNTLSTPGMQNNDNLLCSLYNNGTRCMQRTYAQFNVSCTLPKLKTAVDIGTTHYLESMNMTDLFHPAKCPDLSDSCFPVSVLGIDDRIRSLMTTCFGSFYYMINMTTGHSDSNLLCSLYNYGTVCMRLSLAQYGQSCTVSSIRTSLDLAISFYLPSHFDPEQCSVPSCRDRKQVEDIASKCLNNNAAHLHNAKSEAEFCRGIDSVGECIKKESLKKNVFCTSDDLYELLRLFADDLKQFGYNPEKCIPDSCFPIAAISTDPKIIFAMTSCFGSFYHLLNFTTVQGDKDLICSLYNIGTVCVQMLIAPNGYNCSLTSLKSSVDEATSYFLPTINSAHLFDPEQCPVTPIPGPTPAAEVIPASLTLNKPFHSDMLNKSSTMYKELIQNLTEALEHILKNVNGKVTVTRVRNGSIVVEFDITVMTTNRNDVTKLIFKTLEAEIPKSNTILSTYVNGTLKIVSDDSDTCPPVATLVAEKRFETAMADCFGSFFNTLYTPVLQNDANLLCSLYDNGTRCMQRTYAQYNVSCSLPKLKTAVDIGTTYYLAYLNMTHLFHPAKCPSLVDSCFSISVLETDERIGKLMESCFGSFYYLMNMTTGHTNSNLLCSLYNYGTVCMRLSLAQYGYSCTISSIRTSLDLAISFYLPSHFDPEQCPVLSCRDPKQVLDIASKCLHDNIAHLHSAKSEDEFCRGLDSVGECIKKESIKKNVFCTSDDLYELLNLFADDLIPAFGYNPEKCVPKGPTTVKNFLFFLKLNMTFHPDLSNKSSKMYQEFVKNFTEAFKDVLKDFNIQLTVTKLSRGSVAVEGSLAMATSTPDVTSKMAMEKFEEVASTSNNSILSKYINGSFHIKPVVTTTLAPPMTTSSVPSCRDPKKVHNIVSLCMNQTAISLRNATSQVAFCRVIESLGQCIWTEAAKMKIYCTPDDLESLLKIYANDLQKQYGYDPIRCISTVATTVPPRPTTPFYGCNKTFWIKEQMHEHCQDALDMFPRAHNQTDQCTIYTDILGCLNVSWTLRRTNCSIREVGKTLAAQNFTTIISTASKFNASKCYSGKNDINSTYPLKGNFSRHPDVIRYHARYSCYANFTGNATSGNTTICRKYQIKLSCMENTMKDLLQMEMTSFVDMKSVFDQNIISNMPNIGRYVNMSHCNGLPKKTCSSFMYDDRSVLYRCGSFYYFGLIYHFQYSLKDICIPMEETLECLYRDSVMKNLSCSKEKMSEDAKLFLQSIHTLVKGRLPNTVNVTKNNYTSCLNNTIHKPDFANGTQMEDSRVLAVMATGCILDQRKHGDICRTIPDIVRCLKETHKDMSGQVYPDQVYYEALLKEATFINMRLNVDMNMCFMRNIYFSLKLNTTFHPDLSNKSSNVHLDFVQNLTEAIKALSKDEIKRVSVIELRNGSILADLIMTVITAQGDFNKRFQDALEKSAPTSKSVLAFYMSGSLKIQQATCTYQGRIYSQGPFKPAPCVFCDCNPDGKHTCYSIACAPNCNMSDAVFLPGQCCPVCRNDTSGPCFPLSTFDTDQRISNATTKCFGNFYAQLYLTQGKNKTQMCSVYNNGTHCLERTIAPYGYNCTSSSLRTTMDAATSYYLASVNQTHLFDPKQCTENTTKPGLCPNIVNGTAGIGLHQCYTDKECPGRQKCCSNGFGRICSNPQYTCTHQGKNYTGSFKPDPCTSCECTQYGQPLCYMMICPKLSCNISDAVNLPNVCCSVCKNERNITFGFKLNTTFHPDLLNKSSNIYLDFVKNLTDAIKALSKDEIKRVAVIELKNGSILVNLNMTVFTADPNFSGTFQYTFEKSAPTSKSVLAFYMKGSLKIQQAICTYQGRNYTQTQGYFKPNACTTCKCNQDGSTVCDAIACAPNCNMNDTVYLPGVCCPVCRNGTSGPCFPPSTFSTDERISNATTSCFSNFFLQLHLTQGNNKSQMCSLYENGTNCFERTIAPYGYNCSAMSSRRAIDEATWYFLVSVNQTHIFDPRQCSDKPGSCPRIVNGTAAIGIHQCDKDIECQGYQKCCSNGFGRVCATPEATCFYQGRNYSVGMFKLDPCTSCECHPNGNFVCDLQHCRALSCNTSDIVTPPGQCCSVCRNDKCPYGTPLTNATSGEELFCGRGENRTDCPNDYFCNIAPNDAYAVCCRSASTPTPPPTTHVSGATIHTPAGTPTPTSNTTTQSATPTPTSNTTT